MYDARWSDDARDRDGGSRELSRGGRRGSDPRERERERVEPREVFARHVNLPRDREREHVWGRDRLHMLRGSESRTLASVGAFRVIRTDDLRDAHDKPLDPRHGELWHLREAGLVQTVRLDRDTTVVPLTREGRELLEGHRRDQDAPDRQAFHDGVQRPRELKHDAVVYRAYLEEAERLHEAGAEIHRVILENDLKAEFQTFVQEPNRDREDSEGRPERSVLEIESWAHEHNQPCDAQDHVQFPDVRIEYDIDGREHTLDVEVMTPHYRGAHAAGKSGSGFSLYFSGSGGGGRGGGARADTRARGGLPMTFDERAQAIAKKGFTERQARFPTTVMLHVGVCVPRQYARFCGIVHGAKTRKFFATLVRVGVASMYDCRHNRARIPRHPAGALRDHRRG
jgi:hypothetical protein